MIEIVPMFNAAAHWLDNPMHQMGVVLITPVVCSAIAMLAIRHHDKREAQQSAKGPGPN